MNQVVPALVVDPNYYEPIDNYKPNASYSTFVDESLPTSWRVKSSGVWQYCYPPQTRTPLQGWKIHISGTYKNAREILHLSTPIFVEGNTSFKFASDESMFELMSSKTWSRSSSGKLITAYPQSTEDFKVLLEILYNSLKGFEGPYILTDRKYRDCSVLFYRYGGFQALNKKCNNGQNIPQIISPSGDYEPDKRQPYFSLPDWVEDPFSDEDGNSDGDGEYSLKDNRYRVLRALAFSNAGGVYDAIDTNSDELVVIKEARPNIGTNRYGLDASILLQKEYRLLRKLEKREISAKPIDFFSDWEHSFLAQEKIQGITLTKWVSQNCIALHPAATTEEVKNWFKKVIRVCLNLSKALKVLHEEGIIFGDLSPNNVIVNTNDLSLRLIDFEGACELNKDTPPNLFTPGYATAERSKRGTLLFQDDYYSLGSLFLALLFPINSLIGIKEDVREIIMRSYKAEYGIPTSFIEIIDCLMGTASPSALIINRVVKELEIMDKSHSTLKLHSFKMGESLNIGELTQLRDGLTKHALNIARYQRNDRLFPCSFKYTNPLSIDHGALGVAHIVQNIHGDIPLELRAWIEKQTVNLNQYVPGLYNGLAGIALILKQIGMTEEARKSIEFAYNHELLYESKDLYEGASGVGLSLCKFFYDSGEENYLYQAQNIARTLLDTANTTAVGDFWGDKEKINIGYAKGGSGIAMFFLALYKLTKNDVYLKQGKRALDFDLSFANERDGYLSFPASSDAKDLLLPYWFSGTAGIATTLLRYYSVTREAQYLNLLKRMFADLDRKYTVSPGLFHGITGLGNVLLDYHQILGCQNALVACNKVVSSIAMFIIKQDDGYIMPGEYLYRKSVDFGTGSMGIAAFLNRLIKKERNFNFMLDELILEKDQSLVVS